MNCAEASKLLNAYLDQQLDAAHTDNIEQHIEHCPHCKSSCQELISLKHTLKSFITFHPAPDSLKSRIAKSLGVETSTHKTDDKIKRGDRSTRVKLVTAFAASLLIGFIVIMNYQQHHDDEAFISEVLSSHIRAISGNHHADVNSSETSIIIPWFSRKLDFSPKIFNFSEQGFELTGGRLDSFQQQTIAAVSYKTDRALINVYTWPSPDVDDAPQEAHNKRGYYLLYWCQNNMNYWIVSDGDSQQVDQLARMIQARLLDPK